MQNEQFNHQIGDDALNGVKSQVSNIKSSLQESTQQLTSSTKAEIQSSLETKKNQAAQEIEKISDSVRRAGEELRNNEFTTIASYVEGFASTIDEFSHSIRDKSLSEMLGSARQLAQRNPEVFLGGALLAGFVAARFLKSSQRSETDEMRSDSSLQRFSGAGPQRREVPTATDNSLSAQSSVEPMNETGGQYDSNK